MRRWTVLNVGYPFAPVGPDAVGGAEQILSRLDRALVEAGHRSWVLAADGSVVAGEAVLVPRPPGVLDNATREAHQRRYAQELVAAIRRTRPDVVHLHGVDFPRYLPPPGVPVLVTLHLPHSFYGFDFAGLERPGTFLHCVSETQRATFPTLPNLLPAVPNGVPVGPPPTGERDGYVVCLSRIAPEKNVHAALEAARLADVPLFLGGEVYPYPDHLRYFETEVKPRLDADRRFLGPIRDPEKSRLLRRARCLLQPSLAAETSSLVAMEALAAGVPVVAFPSGALPTIVEHGRTGYLVPDAAAMARAIGETARLDPLCCWRAAGARFGLQRMIRRYFACYRKLIHASLPQAHPTSR